MDRQRDYWGLREKAEEAKAVLGSPIYGMACAALRMEIMDRLVALPAGDPGVAIAHIELKILDKITGALHGYINEYQFRQNKQ